MKRCAPRRRAWSKSGRWSSRTSEPDVDPWDAPFDTSSETSPRVKLARQIAAAVKSWLDRGDLVGDGDKRHAVRAGDILILVRQRGALFEAIIRAHQELPASPVAGADRLVLTEHIAIMDLLVAGRRAAAAGRRSGAGDGAQEPAVRAVRGGVVRPRARPATAHCARALRERRPDLAARLDALGDAARQLTPFAFYARPARRRRRPQSASCRGSAREANDAIDEFLNLALDYESRETPSLQGFVAWLRTASAEVKRDMEMARDEVRVMTVHGAKGLEAPIVILADTTTPPQGPIQYQPRLLSIAARNAAPDTPHCLAWMREQDRTTRRVTAAARSAAIAASENEYRRLLYVAMTRAADRLIVCGVDRRNRRAAGLLVRAHRRRALSASGLLVEEPADVRRQAACGAIARVRRSLRRAPASRAASGRIPHRLAG